MTDGNGRAVLLAALLLVAATLGPPIGGVAGAAASGSRLVVDVDGGADYTEIRDAILDASPGDTVVVRPGEYGVVHADRNVTVVAPDGATVGPVIIEPGVSPTVAGVTAERVEIQDARDETVTGGGDWTLRDARVMGPVRVDYRPGAWTIRDSTVEGDISTRGTTGDWTVRNVTTSRLDATETAGDWLVASASLSGAVTANDATGDWTVRDSTVEGGITAKGTPGDWAVRNLSVRPGSDGSTAVQAQRSTGNWTVDGLRSVGGKIDARGATGAWTVRDAVIQDGFGMEIGGGAGAVDRTGTRWAVRNVTIRGAAAGISATGIRNPGTIHNSTVTGGRVGISLHDAAANVTIRNTTIANVTRAGVDATRSSGDWRIVDSVVTTAGGAGVQARGANGSWAVTGSVVAHNGFTGVSAEGADGTGNATGNWWGQSSGPAGWQCRGAVDCSDPLSSRPARAGDDAPPARDGVGVAGVVELEGERLPLFADVGGPRTVEVAIRNGGPGTARPTVEATFERPDGGSVVRRRDPVVPPGERVRVGVESYPLADLPRPYAAANFSTTVVDNRTIRLTYDGGAGPIPVTRLWLTRDGRPLVPVAEAGDVRSPRLSPGDSVRVRFDHPPYGIGELPFGARSTARIPYSVRVDDERRNGTLVVFPGGEKSPREGDGEGGGPPAGADLTTLDYGETGTGAVGPEDARTGPFVAPHENVTFAGDAGDRVTLALRRVGGEGDPTLALVGPDGERLATNATGTAPRLRDVQLPSNGSYAVVVSGTETNATFAYELALRGRPAGAIVVDDDGGEGVDYTSITPAVGNASDDGTVLVRPGTYEESVAVGGDLTVVAPAGATVSQPATNPDAAFEITGGAPTVEGFTIEGFPTGVLARNTDGDWTVADLAVAGDGRVAVNAFGTAGDWTVRNATLVRDSRLDDTAGVRARTATGDWSVVGSEFAGVTRGVAAADTEGDWRVAGATVRDAGIAVDACGTTGDWAVRHSRIRGSDAGVLATDAAGAWRLRNVTIRNSGDVGLRANGATGAWRVGGASTITGAPVGVEARGTTGAWTVRRTNLTDNDVDVAATDAARRGDARRNYWGPGGTDDADCRGNVTCTDALVAPVGTSQTGLRVEVVGPGGDPVEGATVAVYGNTTALTVRTLDAGEPAPPGASATATTSASGVALLGGVESGERCLLVQSPSDDLAPTGRCLPLTGGVVTDQRVALEPPRPDPVAPSVWRQFQADPQNTGHVDVPGPRRAVVEQWTFDVGEQEIFGSPVVHRGLVFVPAATDTLYALDADTGEQVWAFDGEGQTNGPAAGNGTVYFRAGNTLHALNATTGDEAWDASIDAGRAGAFTRASVALIDGRVVVPVTRGDGSGGYTAYDAETGVVVWDQRFNGTDAPASVVHTAATPGTNEDESLVYVGGTGGSGATAAVSVSAPAGGSSAGTVVDITLGRAAAQANSYTTLLALDADTGASEWTGEQVSDTVFGAPTYARVGGDGVVYAPSKSRGAVQVFARDARTGSVLTIQESGNIRRAKGQEGLNGVLGSPAVDGAELYFGDGALLRNVADNGSALVRVNALEDEYTETTWSVPTGGSHAASPAVTRETVYAAVASTVSEGTVYAVDRSSGERLWRYSVGDVQASPAVHDRSLIAATTTEQDGSQRVFSLGSAFAREPEALVDPGHESSLGHLSVAPVESVDTADPAVDSYLFTRDHPAVETVSGRPVHYRTATFTGRAGQSVTATVRSAGEAGDTLDILEATSLTLVGPEGEIVGTDTVGTGNAVVDATLPRDGVYMLVVSNDRIGTSDYGNDIPFRLYVQSPSATSTSVTSDGNRTQVLVRNATAGDRVTADLSDAGRDGNGGDDDSTPRVTALSVTFAGDASGSFDVSTATTAPADLPTPPTAAAVYLQVDHPGVPDGAIGAGTVTLELPQSTVADPSNVTVYRYDDGWTAVPTEQVGETADAYRFRAITPGFSTFAVGGTSPADTAPNGSDGGATPADEATPGDDVTPGDDETTDRDGGGGIGPSPLPGVVGLALAIAAVAAVVIGGWVVRRRR